MACLNPRTIFNPRYKKMSPAQRNEYSMNNYGSGVPPDLYISIPCGKCKACKQNRQFQYSFRLQHELSQKPNSLFVTLTFDDDSLRDILEDLSNYEYHYYANEIGFTKHPNKVYGELCNARVRKFLDNLRKQYGKGIKHWFALEFGSKNGRPHFHGLLFDVPFNSDWHKTISRLWKYGFSFTGSCSPASCNYVAKYITKDLANGSLTPRIMSSKGLGLTYLNSFTKLFHNGKTMRPYLMYNGKKCPLPRYYKDKIYNEEDKIQLNIERDSKPFEMSLDGIVYTDFREYFKALHEKFIHYDNLNLNS